MPINPTTLKALVDTQITNETVNFGITPAELGSIIKDTIDYTTEQTTGGSVTPDATISVKGKIKLAGDLSGTADLPTVPSLVNKEDLSNKSTNVTTDGLSDTKYPSVKAVKTYVDNNMGGTTVYKVLKTTITSAEVLNIFSTPKTIVPAIAGKIIIPTHIIIVVNFNTTQYSDPGGAWKVRFGSTNTSIATPTNFLASATYNQEVLQTLFYSGFISSSGFTNSPILLTTSGNNPTGGDSGLTVYVSYTEITL